MDREPSSAPASPVCPIYAWPTSCATPTCWSRHGAKPSAWSAPTLSLDHNPELKDEVTAFLGEDVQWLFRVVSVCSCVCRRVAVCRPPGNPVPLPAARSGHHAGVATMRIIAGSAKGRRLEAPRTSNTRPITDRAKESIFSSLGDRVVGARVLDLYAGSGAFGLEALSRGADSADVRRAGP